MKQKLIIAFVGVVALSSCATHSERNELPSTSPRAADIQRSLEKTVIPEIDLENVSLEDALKEWHRISLHSHPQHFDFRYAISHPMKFSSQPVQQGVPPATTSTPARITIRRKSITSARLLDEICGQSGMSWLIMGRVIVVRPAAAMPNASP